MNKLTTNEKYKFYEASVQDPAAEINMLNKAYVHVFRKKPYSFREDFAGTGWISCEWVKQSPKHQAFAVDLDMEPIAYGLEKHWSKLSPKQQDRMQYCHRDVLKCNDLSVDIIGAFNFSYWFFKTRKDLLRYFISVRKSLKAEGLFLLDALGGTAAVDLMTEKRKCRGFTYYWECEYFNPIDHHCRYAIHFKPDKKKIHKKVFTYDWRFWSVPETVDILYDAGFKKVTVFWEGDSKKTGEGNGVFSPVTEAEHCYAWIAYIAACL